MKFMISAYGSQQDYDALTGASEQAPGWSPQDFAAIARFMAELNSNLLDAGELVETRV